MRAQILLVSALGLAACTAPVPDSGAGFSDYGSYMNQRAADPAPAPVAPSGGFSTAGAAAAIDRASGTGAPVPLPAPAADPNSGLISDTRPRGNAPAGIQEDMGEVQARGISDEQDFDAVTARRSIEGDKAQIERNRAQYTVDQPTALPERTGDTGPNLVQYALNTSNLPGQSVYSRSSLSFANPDRACARYASPDLAQQDFLASGGPERDRKGLDPDGDGFVCGWDPRPFRAALN